MIFLSHFPALWHLIESFYVENKFKKGVRGVKRSKKGATQEYATTLFTRSSIRENTVFDNILQKIFNSLLKRFQFTICTVEPRYNVTSL